MQWQAIDIDLLHENSLSVTNDAFIRVFRQAVYRSVLPRLANQKEMASKSRPKQRNSSGKPRSAQSRSDSGLPESDDSSDEEQQLKLKV